MTQSVLRKSCLPSITFIFCDWQQGSLESTSLIYLPECNVCKSDGWVNQNQRLVQAFSHFSVCLHNRCGSSSLNTSIWICVGPKLTNIRRPTIPSGLFLFFSSLALMVYTPFMAFRPQATHHELAIIKPMGGQLEEQP